MPPGSSATCSPAATGTGPIGRIPRVPSSFSYDSWISTVFATDVRTACNVSAPGVPFWMVAYNALIPPSLPGRAHGLSTATVSSSEDAADSAESVASEESSDVQPAISPASTTSSPKSSERIVRSFVHCGAC